jgi:hypothetical protein
MTTPILRLNVQRAIAVLMAGLLGLPSTGFAQQAPQAQPSPAKPPAAAETIRSLRIIALAGRDGENDLQTKVMSPLVVQVLDANDRPVEGASVVFRFPPSGPSASFTDGQLTRTVVTNPGGQARATGWTANQEVGPFAVFVTASRGNEQGTLSIPMTNVPHATPAKERGPKRWWTSKWAILTYIAAAGAIAAIILTHDSSTSIRGVPGTPTIGGPQ